MPWSCSGCGFEVTTDVAECPSCATLKTSWTVVQGQTRQLVMVRRELLLLRGGEQPGELVPATEARVMTKTEARALADAGDQPALAAVLTVELRRGTQRDLTVDLELLFAGRPSEELRLPREASSDDGPVVQTRILFVYGEGSADDLTFPDLRVVDLSEDSPEGYAPQLEIAALGKPARELPVRPWAQESYLGLLRGLMFETNKTFLLPQALPGMRGLKRWYDRRPGLQVLLVGHADKSGDDAYNRDLSLERAEAIAAFVRDDDGPWASWFDASRGSKQWGTREDQYMLSAVGDAAGPFYSGVVDGVAGAGTCAAVERFQTWSNATRSSSLVVDGVCGPLTRAELIPAYMAQDETSLPQGTVLRSHGCGEYHPAVATADGVSEEENRRVEVFLFAEQIEPVPQDLCPAPAGCSEYAVWRERVVEEVDLDDLLSVTPLRAPVEGGTRVRLEIPGATFTDDSQVSFGGREASHVRASLDGAELHATVPPGSAGVVDLTVDGRTEPAAFQYTAHVTTAAQAVMLSYDVHVLELSGRAQDLEAAGSLDDQARFELRRELDKAGETAGELVEERSKNDGADAVPGEVEDLIAGRLENLTSLIDELLTRVV